MGRRKKANKVVKIASITVVGKKMGLDSLDMGQALADRREDGWEIDKWEIDKREIDKRDL